MAVASLGLSSCGDPTYDKDNPAESLKDIADSLSDSKKEELGMAVLKLTRKCLSEGKNINDELHGKTADEIIEMAK